MFLKENPDGKKKPQKNIRANTPSFVRLLSIEGPREKMVRGSGGDWLISYEYLFGTLEPTNRYNLTFRDLKPKHIITLVSFSQSLH